MKDGTRAADFPQQWYVEPNRLDRADDFLPDSRAKQEAHERGEPYFPFPVVGQGNNSASGKNTDTSE